jgi:hypothetical protein
VPYKVAVPAGPGRTPEQTTNKGNVWPVPFTPFKGIKATMGWSKGKLAWMTEGVQKVLTAAVEARKKGEVSPLVIVLMSCSLSY